MPFEITVENKFEDTRRNICVLRKSLEGERLIKEYEITYPENDERKFAEIPLEKENKVDYLEISVVDKGGESCIYWIDLPLNIPFTLLPEEGKSTKIKYLYRRDKKVPGNPPRLWIKIPKDQPGWKLVIMRPPESIPLRRIINSGINVGDRRPG